MPETFDFAARSHVGMVRSNNQDSGYAGPHLLAMADGMGGHAGGDIASSVIVGGLVDLDDAAVGGSEASRALTEAIRQANTELAELTHDNPDLEGMGTTLIAILRTQNRLTLAHIGDSRAFLARGGEVTQITKDHSFVQSLVDEGRITKEEAGIHPQRSLVTRVLTGREEDEPDVFVREAIVGDRYMIASDGLTDYVAADTINEILLSDRSAGDTADTLVELALRAGAPDNVTVVIGDCVDLTKGVTPPPTQPQIVGSAALRRRDDRPTKPIPVTPAEKAAALSQETRGYVDEVDDVTLAEETHTTPGHRLRAALAALATVVIVVGGMYAAYAWSQQRVFVGDYQGNVTVYQGINSKVGPLDLANPKAVTEIKVSDLPEYYAPKLAAGVEQPDDATAGQLLDRLRLEAAACRTARVKGEACTGAGLDTVTGTTPTVTSTTGPTASTSMTASATTSTTLSPSATTGSTP